MIFADEPAFPVFGAWEAPGPGAGAMVFAVDAEARVLMQLRDDRPHLPGAGVWAPFGGGVDAGETLREAAVREFREETGITLAPEVLRPFGRCLSTRRSRARLYAFVTRLDVRPDAIRVGEGAGFAFYTARQLRQIPLAPALAHASLRMAELIEADALPEAQGAVPVALKD